MEYNDVMRHEAENKACPDFIMEPIAEPERDPIALPDKGEKMPELPSRLPVFLGPALPTSPLHPFVQDQREREAYWLLHHGNSWVDFIFSKSLIRSRL